MDSEQATPEAEKEEKNARMWAAFCHLAAFFFFVIPLFGNILGPLVIWLLKKEDSPFVDDQGKEAVNFQITASLAALILLITIVGAFLALLLIIPVAIFAIIAAVKANQGEAYRYPICIRFIR